MAIGLRALRAGSILRTPSIASGRFHNHHRRAFFSNLVSAAELQFGQPLHETHPHLLKPGEVTPGISALEYAHRRTRLASSLPPNSIAIIAASELKYRSGAVFFEYHQDPDFLYLTGFNEPESLAIIEKTGLADEDYNFHLYVRPKDPKAELWEGARSGVQAALDVFNADEADDINKISRILPAMMQSADAVYTDLPGNLSTNSKLNQYLSGSDSVPNKGFPAILQELDRRKKKTLRSLLNELRVFKSESEIQLLRQVGQASGRSITEAMRQTFLGEKDLWNFLDYSFKMNGCDNAAYVPVVAGGENALSIHYVRNDAKFQGNEMVLVDAGGEYGGYITDITRTWPVNGKFNPAQRDLYEVILKVQRSCISLCRESSELSLDKIHEIAQNGLTDALKQLGFNMSGDALDILFPHHLGHHIGLDVHDAPGYSRNKPLKANQCVTIEPGIYVPDDPRWPTHFRGMGIRIEDSVCVESESPFILTTEAVKEIVDIEALRR